MSEKVVERTVLITNYMDPHNFYFKFEEDVMNNTLSLETEIKIQTYYIRETTKEKLEPKVNDVSKALLDLPN